MTSWREAMYNATFGSALVLGLACVLFALVGLNPKSADYGSMPWVYSGLSLCGGIVLWVISGRLLGQLKRT